MVRAPCIDQNGMKKGAWSQEEDNKLRAYVQRYGYWNWRQLPKFAGLNRCGKSCRLRWLNYLKPGVRRGNYTPQEEELILELHRKHGSKWSKIAAELPGRVDNDIKNHWNSHLRRKMKLSSKSTDDDRSSINDFNQKSVSTFDSVKIRNDEMKSDSFNNEVSSLRWEADPMVLMSSWDYAAYNQDSPSSVSMESFWDIGIDHDLQLPAFLEEEIMDEINIENWLHELMQIPQ